MTSSYSFPKHACKFSRVLQPSKTFPSVFSHKHGSLGPTPEALQPKHSLNLGTLMDALSMVALLRGGAPAGDQFSKRMRCGALELESAATQALVGNNYIVAYSHTSTDRETYAYAR